MAYFFDKIPKISYDIQGKQLTNYNSVTNILFRVRIIRSVLTNISSYFEYLVKDDDTPEILAEKIYGNPEAHWIILMANDIIDAQYDWPMNTNDFNRYIIKKYGSIETAQTTIHHYEKVVTRTEELTGIVDENRYVVNRTKLTVNDMTVPYDYYEGTGSLTATQQFTTHNLDSVGKTIVEIINRNEVSNYDYEHEVNERKRAIKIIKPEYYSQIVREFDDLTKIKPAYIRRLI